ncbi:unnamed protein product [Polarella glacialis]|uniref:Uncharacterized protein n=1 Tax=Polarella glacialis TaxID=89957 RepID=A0A813H7J9_POLGL|nr:unnamed protein product [Polarella glacialis]CAE8648530.1 unnamed protein product [Polarella glacialis]
MCLGPSGEFFLGPPELSTLLTAGWPVVGGAVKLLEKATKTRRPLEKQGSQYLHTLASSAPSDVPPARSNDSPQSARENSRKGRKSTTNKTNKKNISGQNGVKHNAGRLDAS